MTKQDQHNNVDRERIEQPLDSLSRTQTRRCRSCGGTMTTKAQEIEALSHPAREKGLRFDCNACEESIWIATTETIVISIISGALIFLGTLYMVATGLMDFVRFSFESGIGSGLLSLLLLVVVVAFAGGALYTIRRGIWLSLLKRQFPLIDAPGQSKAMLIAITLGFIPFAIAIGIGFLNFTYFDDNEVMGIFGIAIAVDLIPKLTPLPR